MSGPERGDAEAALQRAYGAANELVHIGGPAKREAAIVFGLIAVGRCCLVIAELLAERLEALR